MVPLLANKGLYCALPKSMKQYCPMASGGFTIAISDSQPLSPLYVLGVLNSRLLYWVLDKISNRFRGGWITCTKQYVGTLPIRCINFSRKGEKSRHDRIVNLVETILGLHPQLAACQIASDKTLMQRQIDSIERQIDQGVYELYGLTEAEIKIIEQADEPSEQNVDETAPPEKPIGDEARKQSIRARKKVAKKLPRKKRSAKDNSGQKKIFD